MTKVKATQAKAKEVQRKVTQAKAKEVEGKVTQAKAKEARVKATQTKAKEVQGKATQAKVKEVQTDNSHFLLYGVIFISLFLIASELFAGTGGNVEFGGLYAYLKGLSEGFLGRTLAIFAFIVGLGVGVGRSSAVPAIAGIVFAIFVAYGPAIIDGIASALI